MNYNAIEAAYRRFSGPRRDKMTPEEKANIDPETEVKIMNQLQQENLRGDAAYRRFFGPRWDKMTEEQKRSILNDPKVGGRMAAQAQMAQEKRDMDYQKAWQEERQRNRPRVVGPSVGTWG